MLLDIRRLDLIFKQKRQDFLWQIEQKTNKFKA